MLEPRIQLVRIFIGNFRNISQYYRLICKWLHFSPNWIQGTTYSHPEVLLKLSVRSTEFFNEAKFLVEAKIRLGTEWLGSCSIQIVPINHRLEAKNEKESIVDRCYQMCDKRSLFDFNDGPVFKVIPSELELQLGKYHVIGRCHVPSLQTIDDSYLEYKVILWFQKIPIPCYGLVHLSLPLCKNMTKLKLPMISWRFTFFFVWCVHTHYCGNYCHDFAAKISWN